MTLTDSLEDIPCIESLCLHCHEINTLHIKCFLFPYICLAIVKKNVTVGKFHTHTTFYFKTLKKMRFVTNLYNVSKSTVFISKNFPQSFSSLTQRARSRAGERSKWSNSRLRTVSFSLTIASIGHTYGQRCISNLNPQTPSSWARVRPHGITDAKRSSQ